MTWVEQGGSTWTPTPGGVRTAVLLCGGLLMLFHETVLASAPRWELVVAACALMGVELVVRKDRAQ